MLSYIFADEFENGLGKKSVRVFVSATCMMLIMS